MLLLLASAVTAAPERYSLQQVIQHAIAANNHYLNLIDQASMAELDYEKARDIFKTKFSSAVSTDARSGAETGSTYELVMNRRFESGSGFSSGFYSSSFGNQNLSEFRVSYTLPFFRSGLDDDRFRLDSAEIALVKQRRLEVIGREELISRVVEVFYRLMLAERSRELAASETEIYRKRVEATGLRRKGGGASALDVELAQNQLDQALYRQQMMELKYTQTQDQLKMLMGMDLGREVQFEFDAPDHGGMDELAGTRLEWLEQEALKNRTELEGKREEMRLVRSKLEAVSGRTFPEVDVSLQYAWVGEDTNLNDSLELDDQRFGIGLKMSSDLGGSEHRFAQRRYLLNYQAKQREYEQLMAQVKLDVRQAYMEITSQRLQLKLATQAVVLADSQRRESGLRLRMGEVNQLDVLDAEQRFVEAQYQQMSARIGYVLARYQLALAQGEFGRLWTF